MQLERLLMVGWLLMLVSHLPHFASSEKASVHLTT